MNKLVLSASAVVLGLAISSGAMAATNTASSSTGGTSTNKNIEIPGLNNNTLASNNTLTKNVTAHSNNTKNVTAHSNNTSTKNVTAHSNNTKTLTFTKTTNVNKTFNIDKRIVNADQTLSATVTNISFTGHGGQDQRSLNTGAVSWSGGAYQGFGGIQTESVNSGFGSLGQAATMVSANADVTFSHQ